MKAKFILVEEQTNDLSVDGNSVRFLFCTTDGLMEIGQLDGYNNEILSRMFDIYISIIQQRSPNHNFSQQYQQFDNYRIYSVNLEDIVTQERQLLETELMNTLSGDRDKQAINNSVSGIAFSQLLKDLDLLTQQEHTEIFVQVMQQNFTNVEQLKNGNVWSQFGFDDPFSDGAMEFGDSSY